MELNQIAYVFDYVVAAIEQNELLADYDRLIAALQGAGEGEDVAVSAELVSQLRADLVAKHQALEPVDLPHAQRTVLEKYGVNVLMGDGVADTLNQLFIDNFMNPAPIVEYVTKLRVDSAETLDRMNHLKTDLAPLLNDPTFAGDPIFVGEIVDSNSLVPMEPLAEEPRGAGRVAQMVKNALTRPTQTRNQNQNGNAIVPFEETPLHLKVAAALPIALAAAGKAIEIYRIYNDSKTTALAPAPEKKQLPSAQPQPVKQQTTRITQQVRYTYSQTTIYIDNRK